MKKSYIHPAIQSQFISPLSVLCGSDKVSSNIDLHGGGNSGDQTQAF